MPIISTTPVSTTSFPTTSARTVDGITQIDLHFASAMSKGSGTIFVTDGAVQTVIDRATGQPKLRVVGGTFSKEIPLDKLSFSGNHVMFDVGGLPPGASVNVYMAAGTLLSGGKAYAAMTVPGSASFTVPSPGLGATIAIDGNSLKSGEDIAVTITFSKQVASLSPASLSAGNAIISGLATSDGGKTWTARLTGQDGKDAPSNVLRLNMDTVVAGDGSRGAGNVESASYLVDTLVAAFVDSAIEMYDDNGPDDMDGITNGDAMAVGGKLHGSLKAGESFELIINGVTIDPGKIETYPAYEPGTYYWYYIGADSEHFLLGDNNLVQARIVGPGGHSSQTVSKKITVERDAPDIVSKPSGSIDAGQAISISFDEAMYLDDDVEAIHKIVLVDGLGNTSWIALDDSMLSSDGKTLTLDAADHDLATGNDYDLYLPGGLTDLAGNDYEGPAIRFSTSGPFQDKAPPRLVQLYIVNGSGSYKAGEVLEFRLRYTEKVNLEAGTEPVLYLDGGMTAGYAGLANDGTEMVFKYTVKPGDNEDFLNDVDHSWTLYGHVRDDRGNVFERAHVEYDGLTTADGYGAMVTVDTVVARPGMPQLHADSDSGAAGDNSTTDTTPRLTGSGAEAYAGISIYDGAVKIGSATADATGRWDTVLTAALSTGTHQITVLQEDRAGNVSELSSPLSITVDGTKPSVGPEWNAVVEDFDLGRDLVITFSEAVHIAAAEGDDDMLRLIDANGAVQKIAVGNANLSTDKRTLTISSADHNLLALTDYRVQLPATLTDLAGNSMGEYDIRFRTGNDAVPSAVRAVVDGDGSYRAGETITIRVRFNEQVEKFGDSGLSLGLSNSIRAVFTGMTGIGNDEALFSYTVAPGNDYTDVRITDTSELVGRFADLSGNLLDGAHIALADLYDGSGYGTRIDIDTVAPAAPAAAQLDPASNSGNPADLLTNDRTPLLTGSAEAGAKVEIYKGAILLGYGYADASGNWSAGVNAEHALVDGAHALTIRQVDRAGNSSAASAPLTVTVDGTVAALVAPRLADGHDTGVSATDRLTRETRPTLVGGGAEAGAGIKILSGDTVVGFGHADANGNWSIGLFDEVGELGDGHYAFTVKQEDQAGNLSAASAALEFTVDRSGPAAPPPPQLAAASDTGLSDSDGVTSNRTPTFTGSGALANTDIALYIDGVEAGRTTSNASGEWSFTIGVGKLATDTTYGIAVKQFDAAGNASAYSSWFNLVLDTTAPTALAAPDLVAASDSGTSNSDNITNDNTPTFSGSGAPANRVVALIVDSVELGRVTTDMLGNWSITSTALTDGTHQVQVRHFDVAGNQSPDSAPTTVIIDTVRPELTSFHNDRTLKQFELGFSEQVVFHPDGVFTLLRNDNVRRTYHGNDDANWDLVTGSDGKSVLTLMIGMNGTFNLSMNSEEAMQDVAGNVAKIVGMPAWEPDQTI